MTQSINYEALLKEILPLPAEKVIPQRFDATSEANTAPCSGKCEGGTCRACQAA